MKLELVESTGKCPKDVKGCVSTFRILRNTETKKTLYRGMWYICPGHPSPFSLPQTVDEAVAMRKKWLKGDYPGSIKVIDSMDVDPE
ncbi:MAG: hypothetical protein A2998_03315 [Candidatus Staskawiczbacteria bacterium RIFCSPLOWO2_01_FULL_37_25b]|uniref:Uncharacterized protein n=1 Tax=Candidatus Staskawiczbacteria bacterium RIFCSPLOWO2_01_FULL_37_25b TaxID=1802213 RepID=A0A1G2IB15_9BACT|nr:MAG: hypothetical protein A2998_03315 [Candidatus Staskawiczbacteria bacterium RIFCSPLOWO2_01_FULL_37_25b]